MDSFFRDGLKSRKLTYVYSDRTNVTDVSGKIKISQRPGDIEEWHSHKPYTLSNIKLYEACGVKFTAPGITIPQTFFRLKKTLEIICPSFIESFVRKIVITPETFTYTDKREGQDPDVVHTSRTFLVKGHVDFEKNKVSLEVYNATLEIFTQDLTYPRVSPKEEKAVESGGFDVTPLMGMPSSSKAEPPKDSGVISNHGSSSSLKAIPEDLREGQVHGAKATRSSVEVVARGQQTTTTAVQPVAIGPGQSNTGQLTRAAPVLAVRPINPGLQGWGILTTPPVAPNTGGNAFFPGGNNQ